MKQGSVRKKARSRRQEPPTFCNTALLSEGALLIPRLSFIISVCDAGVWLLIVVGWSGEIKNGRRRELNKEAKICEGGGGY